MAKVFKGSFTVVVEEDVTINEVKDYLKDAVILDIDTEEHGSIGASITLDYETLELAFGRKEKT
jgi:hypothetical protein